MEFVSFGLLGIGIAVVYKVLSAKSGNPNTVLPKRPEFGDDKMTLQTGQHLSARTGTILVDKVSDNLGIATINGKKYYVDPSTLGDVKLTLPPHQFV
jgi:hypothetical protein